MTEMAKIIVDHMVKTTFDHNSLKTISFGAAHTYIALKREYTPPRIWRPVCGNAKKASSSTKQLFFSTFDALKYKLVLFKDDCSS